MEILVSHVNASNPTQASAYQARDVVNAPAIKQRIRTRSEARDDSREITDWLTNHFYRHVVGNLAADPPAVQPISDLPMLEQLCAPHTPPSWAVERLRKLQAGIPLPTLWWIDPDATSVLGLESKLVEFLSTRKGTSLEGKLQRINCPQALARWTLEHLAFEYKQQSGWVEHCSNAVHGILRGQLGTFVEFDSKSPDLRQEMAYESQMMGHCVGQFSDRKRFRGGYGEHYADACEKGKMRLFSYRTGSAQPRITVNALVKKDGLLEIEQIKGKQNRPPIARYLADVVALLNHLPLNAEVPSDAIAMGIVRRPDALLALHPHLPAWCAVADLKTEAEQMWLIQAHPDLIAQLSFETPLMQWMVAARKESMPAEAVDGMPKSQALQTALAMSRKRSRRVQGEY